MTPRRWTTLALLLLLTAAGFWVQRSLHSRLAPVPRRTTVPPPHAVVRPPNPKIAALAASISSDAISPIANDLNAPGGDIRRDLDILNSVFVAWQTNFPREGNPVGENDEITAALAGDNPLHFAFVSPRHPAINVRGQLCDRWGTPFRFHQLSGTQMEIRSAGPDRRFGTTDDVEFAPWPKQQ